MVRYLVAMAAAALAVVSCAGPRPAVPELGLDDRGPDDFESAEARYEAIERLVDNPIDPRRARVEDLLAIPEFPASLAESVVRAAGACRPGRRWTEELTPPERSRLYRYDGIVILPDRASVSLRERLTADRLDGRGRERIDSYTVSAGDCWRLLVRCRDFDARRKGAFYAGASVLSGIVSLHAGSLAPDFGFGLVFGGTGGPDLLSGAYPFGGDRWIAGSTSFSERVLSGVATEVYLGKARAAFLAGRPRVYGSRGFELTGDPVIGARLGARCGAWQAGAGALQGAAQGDRWVYSVDGKWTGAGLLLGLEAAGTRPADPACAWGGSYRTRRTRLGVLFHTVPAGVCGAWSGLNGRELSPSCAQRGIAASGEVALAGRCRLRGSFERYVKDDGFEQRGRDALRFECERDTKALSVRLSWSLRESVDEALVPCPGAEAARRSADNTYGLSCSGAPIGWLSVRMSARYAVGRAGKGVLFAPVVVASFLSDALRAECSFAMCRALDGRPIHYFAEPSLSGMMPWASAVGDSDRTAFIMICKLNKLSISSKVKLEDWGSPEGALQASLGLD